MKFGTTFVLAVALWPSVLPAQQHVAPQALVPGEAVEREIAAGDSHVCNIQVSQGQYLHAVVHPSGVSLGVVLLDGPGGKQLAGFVANPGAAPNLFSLTSLHWIAHTSGIYRLELRVVQGNHGSYELKTDRLRAPTPQDRDRASGAEVFSVACEEYDRQRARVGMAPNAPPSQLLVKLDEALKLMNDAGDLGAEVDISNTKSAVALDIGEYDAALAASSHGLTLARRLGDQARENKTLLQLILIYSIFGDYQKVLNSSFQAFQLGYASGSTNLQFERTQVVGAYIKLGKPESAIEFLNAFPPEADDPINRAAALLDLGDAYTEMKQAGKAIEDLDGALSLAVTMHNKPMEGRASISLSRAYSSWAFIIRQRNMRSLVRPHGRRRVLKDLQDLHWPLRVQSYMPKLMTRKPRESTWTKLSVSLPLSHLPLGRRSSTLWLTHTNRWAISPGQHSAGIKLFP